MGPGLARIPRRRRPAAAAQLPALHPRRPLGFECRFFCWTGIYSPVQTRRCPLAFLPPFAGRSRESRPAGLEIPRKSWDFLFNSLRRIVWFPLAAAAPPYGTPPNRGCGETPPLPEPPINTAALRLKASHRTQAKRKRVRLLGMDTAQRGARSRLPHVRDTMDGTAGAGLSPGPHLPLSRPASSRRRATSPPAQRKELNKPSPDQMPWGK